MEGFGLLDLPGATIGRREPCRHIWSRLVAPLQAKGIEPVTGLPRSLVDIMARVDSDEAYNDLQAWTPQEKAEHVLQYPFWEAFRLMLLLVNQDLVLLQHSSDDNSTAANQKSPPPTSSGADTEYVVMRILSCIKALQTLDVDDPFRIPLQNCIIWPLFTAALHTEADSHARALVAHEFQAFVNRRNKLVDRTAWAVIGEVWARRAQHRALHPLEVAHEFATDIGVELHLY